MILSKTAEVKLWAKNMQYFLDLGYKGKKGDIINVNIEHLTDYSYSKIEVLCDICNKHKTVVYRDYRRSIKETGSYVCKDCISKKSAQTNMKRYGTKVASQNEEIKEKMKKTIIERCGVDNAMKNEEIKERLCETNLKKRGVPYPSQSKEVRNKINESFYRNNTQKVSKQQLYLHHILGGELNYPIEYYSSDICFPTDKLIIEYDGSGHELNIKFGRITEEEHLQKEIIRFNTLKRNGYKQIHIISKHDFLPSNDVLFQMLSIAKKYFNTTSHTWINFDIDNLIMINAENKDIGGEHFDYGELRKIKSVS